MSFTLTILGTAAPYPQPGRACSGYLLTADEARVWVDAGPGSLANLQRHTPLPAVDAIWISHVHADHAADLIGAYYALAYGGLGSAAPIPVFAPASLGARLAGFFGSDSADFLESVLRLYELHDGHRIRIKNLELTARAVQHDVESYGLRAEYDGRVLAYSGDSGPCASLDALAQRADLLLCEANSGQRSPDHLTPEDAGSLAGRVGVDRLVITHVGPDLTPEVATARAAVSYGGRTDCAREGDSYRLS